jgi:hypothetical protein
MKYCVNANANGGCRIIEESKGLPVSILCVYDTCRNGRRLKHRVKVDPVGTNTGVFDTRDSRPANQTTVVPD